MLENAHVYSSVIMDQGLSRKTLHKYTARTQPTYNIQISTTFIWQEKSSEKKLSGFMVYKKDMAAL